MLFYYRLNESNGVDYDQPQGVILLEGATVDYENSRKVPFAFSIIFADDEMDKQDKRKHIFACRSEVDVEKWVDVLKSASYENLRTELKIIEKKLEMRKGDNNVNKSQLTTAKQLNWHKQIKSKFTCHVQELDTCTHQSESSSSTQVNLIDL